MAPDGGDCADSGVLPVPDVSGTDQAASHHAAGAFAPALRAGPGLSLQSPGLNNFFLYLTICCYKLLIQQLFFLLLPKSY